MTKAVMAVSNGVNVEALLGAREALSAAPEAAKFVWRVASEWKSGTHTESSVEGFFGLGQEQKHVREFRYATDHPEIFASEDKGSTPVEMVLVGLAGCLTAGRYMPSRTFMPMPIWSLIHPEQEDSAMHFWRLSITVSRSWSTPVRSIPPTSAQRVLRRLK